MATLYITCSTQSEMLNYYGAVKIRQIPAFHNENEIAMLAMGYVPSEVETDDTSIILDSAMIKSCKVSTWHFKICKSKWSVSKIWAKSAVRSQNLLFTCKFE